jgi:hypothetical protein
LPLDLLEKLAFHKREEVRRVATRRLDERRAAAGASPEAQADQGVMVVAIPLELRDRWTPAGDRLRPAN